MPNKVNQFTFGKDDLDWLRSQSENEYERYMFTFGKDDLAWLRSQW